MMILGFFIILKMSVCLRFLGRFGCRWFVVANAAGEMQVAPDEKGRNVQKLQNESIHLTRPEYWLDMDDLEDQDEFHDQDDQKYWKLNCHIQLNNDQDYMDYVNKMASYKD